jgi:sulfate/thiosulfate transport system ATP-binding protein
MNEGKIVQIGTPQDIYDHPASPFVASFMGGANVFRSQVRVGRATLGGVAVDVPQAGGAGEGDAAYAYVRPHEVKLSKAADDAESDSAVTVARVERMGFLGAHVKVSLRLPDGSALSVEIPTAEVQNLGIQEGDRVLADLQQAKIFVGDYAI